jgi:membrane glycosyltransferase
LPRILGLAAVVINGQQASYGGTLLVAQSALLETDRPAATIRMLAHRCFVVVALTGLKFRMEIAPAKAATRRHGRVCSCASWAPMSTIPSASRPDRRQ